MNTSWLTLRDIEYLVMLADTKHFGKAAEKCFVSQPSLSAQVKKVENHLGVTLFERTNRKVTVTAQGEVLLTQARLILEESKKFIELSKKRTPFGSGLRVGAIATIGPYLAPYFLAPFRKKYAQCELVLREGLTDDLIRELRNGTLDMVIASSTFSADGLKSIPLFEEEFLWVASKQNELSKKVQLRTTDLKAAEMVLLEDGHCLKDQTLDFCSNKNRSPDARKFHATSLSTLIHLVAAGHGYTLIPRLACDWDSKLNELIVSRPFEGRFVGRDVTLFVRDRFPSWDEAVAFAQLIQRSLSKAPVRVNSPPLKPDGSLG